MSLPVHSNALEKGVYNILNVKAKTAIDIRDSKAQGHPQAISPTQGWRVIKKTANVWALQQVASGKYLGLKLDDNATNGFQILTEDDHEFGWRVEVDGTNPNHFTFWVPYSNYVLDLEGYGKQNAGTKIQLWTKLNGDHQKWFFSKGLEELVSGTLKHGGVYRIINDQTKTAVQLNKQREASGFALNESNAQRWQAVKTVHGWAFRNLESLQFLGRPSETSILPNGTRVIGTTEFTWIVMPDSTDTTRFKLRVPYTGKLMNLSWAKPANDTPVDIWDDTMQAHLWWRFEALQVPGADAGDGINGDVGVPPHPCSCHPGQGA